MITIRTNIRKSFFGIAVTIVSLAPLVALSSVSAASNSDTGCTPPSASSYGPGVHAPVGSSAPAFVYQCPDPQNPAKPYVGDWRSAHYVYYPQTNDTEPLTQPVYTYNALTGQYDYSEWAYNANASSYQQQSYSIATPPAGADVVGGPVATITTPTVTGSSDASSDTGGNNTDNTSLATLAGTNNPTADNNGSNTINNTAGTNSSVNNGTTQGVNNTIVGTATSGNATIDNDAIAGNATSGNTLDEANVINMLQSSSNALGAGTTVATFTYNINGDINGDLLFNPSMIGTIQGTDTVTNNASNTVNINNASNLAITNNLTLGSTSGNADVTNDAQAGNATTGNAEVIANIVNSIDSAITAGQSFIGTININGNLSGNILLPANFVNDLLADNIPTVTVAAPDTSTNTATNTSTVTNTNNEGIANTVTSTANSGNATLADDAVAGSATSGSANTHVTAFNLTGSSVVASNDILVFVNVLGTWTGLILNAPAGATAAELGGGVTENNTTTNTTTDTNTTNENITNNLNLNAQSGNATVAHDAQAGSATSGNADTAANLLNIEGSTLNLSNWFGILFINVFGTWNGSLGVETNPVSNTGTTPVTAGDLVGTTSPLARSVPQVTSTITAAPPTSTTTGDTTPTGTGLPTGTVLAAHTTKLADTTAPTPQLQGHKSDWKTFSIIGSLVILYIITDAIYTHRRHHRKLSLPSE
jgi:hypothetical protein